jgi:hypothetical protein
MIEQLTHVPINVAAFRATGTITEDDFKLVVIPAMSRMAERVGQVNYLLVLDTSISNFSFGAWMQEILLGLRHLTRWKRVAIVSGSDGIAALTDLFSVFVPGEFRGFYHEQMQVAIEWTSGKEIES